MDGLGLDWPSTENVDTGDLVFFDAHDGTFSTWLIETTGHCPYSHVGMAVRLLDGSMRLGLWEATNGGTHGQVDMITQQPVRGVRLVEFAPRLAMEPHYAVMRLQTPSAEERAILRQLVWAFVVKNVGKSYENNVWRLIYAWYDGPTSVLRWIFSPCGVGNGDGGGNDSADGLNAPSTDSFFCSDLVVETLIAVGVLLPRRLPPNPLGLIFEAGSEFTPGDLCDRRTLNARLAQGYVYGNLSPPAKAPLSFSTT